MGDTTRDVQRPHLVDDLVVHCLEDGHTPNDITSWIEDALSEIATDWVEWGDGRWRLDKVCPICGDAFAGVCGHRGMYEGETILRREFVADPSVDPEIITCHQCKREVHRDTTKFRGFWHVCFACQPDEVLP